GQETISYLRGDEQYANRLSFPFPNVLFLNCRMPELSGLGVLCWLRSETHFEHLPVVMLSNAFSPAQADIAARMHAACCTKSAAPGRLMEAIAQSVRLVLRSSASVKPQIYVGEL